MVTGPQRIPPVIACLAVLLTVGACDTPSPAPPVQPSVRKSATAAEPSDTAAPLSGPEVVGTAPADLRDVDWPGVPAPGEFCDVPGLVRFGPGGEAEASSSVWGAVRVIQGKTVLHGDTDGDDRDEALVYVGCDDNGRTQNTQLVAGYVLYGRQGEDLVVLGSISPRQRSESFTTALAGAEFAPGEITVHEKWYRANDPHCCPTGDALTVWTLDDDGLTPGDPHITS